MPSNKAIGMYTCRAAPGLKKAKVGMYMYVYSTRSSRASPDLLYIVLLIVFVCMHYVCGVARNYTCTCIHEDLDKHCDIGIVDA